MPRMSTAPGARRRSRRACDSCKRRKQKCNGERPCTLCIQRQKESECHFSDKPSSLLRPGETNKLTMLPSECSAPSQQQDIATDGLLDPLEHQGLHLEEQVLGEKEGTAPVPNVARILRDGEGKFIYMGDSASLSFLQSVRRIVSSSIGRCDFTEDNLRHSMLEAFRSNHSTQPRSLVSPPSNGEAQRLVRQYLLVTSPLLDLFDLDEFYSQLANWTAHPSSEEDTVSSIFYLVLAIGAQVSNANQNMVEQYFDSGCQCAFLAFQDTPSIYTIQSYILVSMYMLGACRRNGAFMNLGVALRAAYAIGIHCKDVNALFCGQERRARERVWNSLRVMDLFLSASLGRPPATSDYGYDIHDDALASPKLCQNPTPEQQVSAAMISLSRIFERILKEVYMKQELSITVAENISSQHRAWVRTLPTVLKRQIEQMDNKTMESSLAAAHVFVSYYWSIILLTRPFLTYNVGKYVKNRNDHSSSCDTEGCNSRIALFADACVYSALRGLSAVEGLGQFASLPRCLPFLINSVFNSAVVLGVSCFADYDHRLPLEEGLNKAERFLGLFVPHDRQACRFSQIIKYLHAAVADYIQRRNHRWMDQHNRQVGNLFGQVGGSGDTTITSPGSGSDILAHPGQPHPRQPASIASPFSPDKLHGANPSPFLGPLVQQRLSAGPLQSGNDVWDVLAEGATDFSYDAAISALSTTGIPVGRSPAGSVSGDQPPILGAPSPLSQVMFPENGLLYLTEDLPVFGIGENM